MKILIYFIPLVFLFTSCGVITGSKFPWVNKGIETINEVYPDDNVVEEAIESGIEKVTGVDVDLSPRSPEKK